MKRSQLDLHRFEKVLALLDSAVEGEALAALGRAKHLLAGAGISFNELKVGISGSSGNSGGGDESADMGGAVETAHVQKLEHEIETLRWSLARHELQIATLRQSVEEKSVLIQVEQAKRHAQEGELQGLRKAHAVQMEAALNSREEAEKLWKQLEVYRAVEKVTGSGLNTSIRQNSSKTTAISSGVKSLKSSRPEASSRKPVASMNRTPPVCGSESIKATNKAQSKIQQGALDLTGGVDNSVGKEYRWARLEEKHQIVGEGADARQGGANDALGDFQPHGKIVGLQVEA